MPFFRHILFLSAPCDFCSHNHKYTVYRLRPPEWAKLLLAYYSPRSHCVRSYWSVTPYSVNNHLRNDEKEMQLHMDCMEQRIAASAVCAPNSSATTARCWECSYSAYFACTTVVLLSPKSYLHAVLVRCRFPARSMRGAQTRVDPPIGSVAARRLRHEVFQWSIYVRWQWEKIVVVSHTVRSVEKETD
jgi:hypothetical protein